MSGHVVDQENTDVNNEMSDLKQTQERQPDPQADGASYIWQQLNHLG